MFVCRLVCAHITSFNECAVHSGIALDQIVLLCMCVLFAYKDDIRKSCLGRHLLRFWAAAIVFDYSGRHPATKPQLNKDKKAFGRNKNKNREQ